MEFLVILVLVMFVIVIGVKYVIYFKCNDNWWVVMILWGVLIGLFLVMKLFVLKDVILFVIVFEKEN